MRVKVGTGKSPGATGIRLDKRGTDMATFIGLMNWTEQGIKNVKDSPARVAEVGVQMGALGVEIKSIFVTMGRYDLVAIVEAPSAEAVASAVLGLARQGNIRTETLQAFPFEEFASDILPNVG